MRNKIIILISIIGLLAGVFSAYLFRIERKPEPPFFKPISNPYQNAIYVNGIIESEQFGGSNINIYPEVSGQVSKLFVREGELVSAGETLLSIDNSVQKATTEQLKSQSEAALALLNELKAEPRKETLDIAKSQVDLAQASLKTARDQYNKRRISYDVDSKSISKDALDTAENSFNQAAAGLDVARKQYELVKAGAWSYDIANQERQYDAVRQTYNAANALLQKYDVKSRVDGVVLAINAATGSYVSSQGAYNAYTQEVGPLIVMGGRQENLAVRCYVDEILLTRLPAPEHIRAQLSIRGTDIKIPLEFVRIQPYVSPKIELSNQRQEKVDLRVLPVIFRFQKKALTRVYPGQLVDVYIGEK